MGRTAGGVRGIKLAAGQTVISLIINGSEDSCVLTSTEKGYGKRTIISDYPVHGRGGQGVISIQTTDRNGDVVGAVHVTEDDGIMLITDVGTLVRTRVAEVSVMGRNTQGVRLVNLGSGERLVGIERIVEEDQDDEDEGE